MADETKMGHHGDTMTHAVHDYEPPDDLSPEVRNTIALLMGSESSCHVMARQIQQPFKQKLG